MATTTEAPTGVTTTTTDEAPSASTADASVDPWERIKLDARSKGAPSKTSADVDLFIESGEPIHAEPFEGPDAKRLSFNRAQNVRSYLEGRGLLGHRYRPDEGGVIVTNLSATVYLINLDELDDNKRTFLLGIGVLA